MTHAGRNCLALRETLDRRFPYVLEEELRWPVEPNGARPRARSRIPMCGRLAGCRAQRRSRATAGSANATRKNKGWQFGLSSTGPGSPK